MKYQINNLLIHTLLAESHTFSKYTSLGMIRPRLFSCRVVQCASKVSVLIDFFFFGTIYRGWFIWPVTFIDCGSSWVVYTFKYVIKVNILDIYKMLIAWAVWESSEVVSHFLWACVLLFVGKVGRVGYLVAGAVERKLLQRIMQSHGTDHIFREFSLSCVFSP